MYPDGPCVSQEEKMSYSRWGPNSVFYTYYACSYSYERDDQVFDVCGVKCFSYAELKKDDFNRALAEVKKLCPDTTMPQLQELKGYMEEFMVDVEHDIALNLVQDIKRAKLKDLPELHRYLTEQTANNYDKDVYEDLLEDIRKILYEPAAVKEDFKTPIGHQLFEKKLLIPKNTRFDLLKN
jgi:hypothetical protein